MVRSHDLTCHRSCLEAQFRTPATATCPDCGVSLKDYAVFPHRPNHDVQEGCPSCGRTKPLGGTPVCSVCGLPIYDFQKLVKGRLRSLAYVYNDTAHHTLHDFCAKSENAGAYLQQQLLPEASYRLAIPYSYAMASIHDFGVAVGLLADEYWLFRSKQTRARIRLVSMLCILVTLTGTAIVAKGSLHR